MVPVVVGRKPLFLWPGVVGARHGDGGGTLLVSDQKVALDGRR